VDQLQEVTILVEEGGEAQLLELSPNGLSHVKLTAINVDARIPVPQELNLNTHSCPFILNSHRC